MISEILLAFNKETTSENDLREYMDTFTLEDWIYVLDHFSISDNFVREIKDLAQLKQKWVIFNRMKRISIKMCYEILKKDDPIYLDLLVSYICHHNQNYDVIAMIDKEKEFFEGTDWYQLYEHFKWSTLFNKKFKNYFYYYIKEEDK